MQELINIQSALKAPKDQYSDFGDYHYRSCEDILEAVKPLLKEQKCYLTLSDEIVMIGEKTYIKATATIWSEKESVSTTAYAQEETSRPKMAPPQLTGTASSYARKYALNGLFCIDDTKDPDTDEFHGKKKDQPRPAAKEAQKQEKTATKTQPAADPPKAEEPNRTLNTKEIVELQRIAAKYGFDTVQYLIRYHADQLKDLRVNDYKDFAKNGKALIEEWRKKE